MTIGGWLLFGIIVIILIIVAIAIGSTIDSIIARVVVGGFCGIVIAVVLVIMLWYFNNTAAGQWKMIDQKSNLQNGIERVINVYTANGDLIASYKGKIGIADKDGGYIKFDYDGKRYIYYNCFVETIAQIEE